MSIADEIERRALTDLLQAAQEFYENSANRKAFEDWKQSEEAKRYLKACQA